MFPSAPLRSLLPLVALLAVLGWLPGVARAQPGAPRPTVTASWNTAAVTPGAQQVVAVVVDIPDGFHAQSATPSSPNYIALAVTTDAPAGLTLHPPIYPKGVDESYTLLGTLNVYEGRVIVYLPVTISGDAPVGSAIKVSGKLLSQLCDDTTCFAPSNVPFEATATVAAAGSPTAPTDASLFTGFDWSQFGKPAPPATRPAPAGDATTIFGFELTKDSVFPALLGALLVGLIFNVMPCVLPVLPLKAVGFIQAAEKSRAKSVLLGIAFSAGLIAIFAALGIAIFGWGKQWGFLFQSNAFVAIMVVVLLFMTLSQWGLFTLSLPVGVYNFEPNANTVTGNFFFGGFTALLSTPCTAYVFPALLAWGATQTRPVAILMLTTVGLGMALPYFAMSCFPALARRVPRTGPWSEIVKQMMGFLILATAVYFAGTKLLHGFKFLYPVAAIAVIAGLFLVYRTAKLMPRPRPIAVAALVAALIAGAGVYGALAFNRKGVEWVPYSDKTLADARAANRTVLIDFTANWCANCHYIEATVFTDREVKKALLDKHILLLRVDITNERAPGSDLLRQLNPAGGIPLTAIYRPGQDQPKQIAAVYTANTLLQALK